MKHSDPSDDATSLSRLADACCWLQKQLIAALMIAVVVFITFNVASRALGLAIYWVDELVIYIAIWAAMLGAAVSVRTQQHIAVGLLASYLNPRRRSYLAVFNHAVMVLFSIALLGFCWLWFDPWLLLRTAGNLNEFASRNFNFIYHEPTSTLGFSKFWAWLIMPVNAVSMLLYSLTNLLEALRATRGSNTP